MSDDYRAVTTRLRAVSEKAIFVDRPANQAGTVTIPRSLLHGSDDLAIERRVQEGAFYGAEITFRLRAWKAEEIGFA